jgi:hypothetical protein
MGQVLHGSARTTEAIRRAIQHSQDSLRALAKRYGINQKTVAKWKKRSAVADLPEEGPFHGIVAGRRGDHRRLPQAYAAAAGRLPLCASADDPDPDALILASLPAAARHFEVARGGGRQAEQEEVQGPATSISISPRSRPPRASSISMSPLIAQANSPSSKLSGRRGEPPRPAS